MPRNLYVTMKPQQGIARNHQLMGDAATKQLVVIVFLGAWVHQREGHAGNKEGSSPLSAFFVDDHRPVVVVVLAPFNSEHYGDNGFADPPVRECECQGLLKCGCTF